MRVLIALAIASCCFTASAKSQLLRRVDALEARVKALEEKLNSTSTSQNGLRVKDMGNKSVGSNVRNVSGQSAPQLTREKQEQIERQLQEYQKRQKEQQKVLEELMNDDF